MVPIPKLIKESKIVVFAPHFDDFLFTIGGYSIGLKELGLRNTKKFHIMILFSRSNYMAGTGAGNYDTSLDRIKLATGKRVLEDMNCLDELLGEFDYRYTLCGERECFTRGKVFADSEMEFPHGMYDDFDRLDEQIFARIKERIREWALQEDTALIFPLAIKEHIDHFIVREAAIKTAHDLGASARAAFYFQEDKPYGGIASPEELQRIEEFVQKNALIPRPYGYDPEQVIELAFKHYISQVEVVYKKGIRQRSEFLQAQYGVGSGCDQIYLFDAKG